MSAPRSTRRSAASSIDVGAPDNLTMNQLVAELQRVHRAPARVRHIPRPVLRALAPLSRRVAAALAMDTTPLTYEPADAPRLPGLPMTGSPSALRLLAEQPA